MSKLLRSFVTFMLELTSQLRPQQQRVAADGLPFFLSPVHCPLSTVPSPLSTGRPVKSGFAGEPEGEKIFVARAAFLTSALRLQRTSPTIFTFSHTLKKEQNPWSCLLSPVHHWTHRDTRHSARDFMVTNQPHGMFSDCGKTEWSFY